MNQDAKFEKFIQSLKEIKPIDIRKRKTSMQEAVQWAESISNALMECELPRIDDDKKAVVSATLKGLGALSLEELNQMHMFKKGMILGDIMNKKDDIKFPLSAFAQFIETDPTTFNYAYTNIFKIGESAWIKTWINAQKQNNNDDAANSGRTM